MANDAGATMTRADATAAPRGTAAENLRAER